MSDTFWRRINCFFGLLPIGALFGLMVFTSGLEIKDLDLWLHLAVGKFITLNGYVPDVDILSWTIEGQPWSNHEWLFQVIVYNIYAAFGPDGLIRMQTVIVTGTMLILLFLGYQKNRQLLTTFLLLIVLLVYQQRFTIRPDIYSLLFFTLYIFTLSLFIHKRWSIFFLFFVQILWANMHGFFFFGPLFVLIGLLSEWIKRHIPLPYEWNESGRLTDEEYGRLGKIFIFVCLACLVNPHTVQGAIYPIVTFFTLSGENKIFFDYIQELQKPIVRETLFEHNRFIYYKICILLSFVSFVFNRRKIDISALFLWIVFLIFSLKAIRNTTFFAFASFLIIITNSLHISFSQFVPLRFTGAKFRHITEIFVKLMLLFWIFGYCQAIVKREYYDFDKYEWKSEFGGIAQRSYPDKAVDFLVENNIKGNFFNGFNSGAYLLGRTFPDIKVFIDGRTEAYGGAFFKEYRNIWEHGQTENFEKMVKKYNVSGALLNSAVHRIPSKILKYFYTHQDWTLVYFNYDGVVFLRNIQKNAEVIKKFTIDLEQWEPEVLDVPKIGPVRTTPYQQYYRAFTLESLGLDKQALAEVHQGLRLVPGYTRLHEIVGKIAAKEKDYSKALDSFRLALLGDPNNKKLRHNLALAYYDLAEYEGAIERYKRIVAIWPADPQGHFLISRTYIKNQQYDKALEALKQAYTLAPNAVGDVMGVGGMLFDQEAYSEAKEVYMLALESDKENEEIKKKLENIENRLLQNK
ncbi:hypothetical protein MNBD_UNCLBAC01-972 [hydrothermal vent metagenome]|uniref:Uncharacterized protein n=1 Tax=hydrothermal vent metagenome TaxID=652676 RepID=A0A3B1DH00_9ZZZZ